MASSRRVSTLERELQKYLEDNGVPEILTDLLVEVCREKPRDVLPFMIDVLRHRKQSDRRCSGSARSPSPQRSVEPADRLLVDTAPEWSQAEEIDLRTTETNRRRYSMATTRRGGVSSESPDDDAAEGTPFEPVRVPKSDGDRARLAQAISGNPIFSHLEEAEKNVLYDAFFEVSKEAKEIVIKQGDEGDNFYVVDAGVLDVYKALEVPMDDGSEPQAKHVLTIEDGGMFGELALLYDTPRQATVQARTACKLWALDRRTFQQVVRRMMIEKRKQFERFLGDVPILSSLDEYERTTIADALTPCNFADGEVIIREGEQGDDFFIILEGNVIVTRTLPGREEESEVGRLGASSFFGEIALLTDQPRLATITCDGAVRCARLDRASFTRLLGPIEDILRRNMETYNKFMATKI